MKIIDFKIEENFIIRNIPKEEYNFLITFLKNKGIENRIYFNAKNIRIIKNIIQFHSSNPYIYDNERFDRIKKYDYNDFYNKYMR